jgi:hypothetical protein
LADYEQSDAIPGRLLGFGLATLLLVVLSALAMGWLHHAWRQAPGPLAPVAVETPVDPDPPSCIVTNGWTVRKDWCKSQSRRPCRWFPKEVPVRLVLLLILFWVTPLAAQPVPRFEQHPGAQSRF